MHKHINICKAPMKILAVGLCFYRAILKYKGIEYTVEAQIRIAYNTIIIRSYDNILNNFTLF